MTTRAGAKQSGGVASDSKSVLWMGDVDENMDEDSVRQSFADMDEPVEYVRVMRPKDGSSVSSSGYAFVGFRDEESAQRVLSNLNGRAIPNAEGKRFKLNASVRNSHSSHFHQNRYCQESGKAGSVTGSRTSPSGTWQRTDQRSPRPLRPEFTAYIGFVTVDMDDDSFFQLFQKTYPSVFSARIMRTPDGNSKQFAFVRFRDEVEYSEALAQEQRISALLTCPIRISKAHPRPQGPRRWSHGQHDSRPFSPASNSTTTPVPQLIEQSGPLAAKSQASPNIRSPDPQRLVHQPASVPQHYTSLPTQTPLSQPSAHYAQDPSLGYYYIPVPSYPAYPTVDPAFWPNSWHEMYAAVPMSPDVSPAVPQAYGVAAPEAGDAVAMHAYHTMPRPVWPVHAPALHHYGLDQRFYFTATEVPDATVSTKDPTHVKSDVSQE